MKLDIQLLDSKGELIRSVTQWDINRAIRIQGLHLSDAPVIRLSNANSEEAVSVQSEIKDNIVEFVIPNEFLQTPINVRVCVCVVNGDEYMTISKFEIPVIKQIKPEDYDSIIEELTKEVNEGEPETSDNQSGDNTNGSDGE